MASERTFRSASSPDKAQSLPDLITDAAECALSVVVPAFNEEKRLSQMLDEALDHLRSNYADGDYEIIIVDDGSRDSTVQTALDFAKEHAGRGGETIRVVKLVKNRGKGGAVKHGVMHARGERILFVDADGATSFNDLAKLQSEMDLLVGPTSASKAGGKAKRMTRSASKANGINGHAHTQESSAESKDADSAIVIGSRAHMVTSPAVVQRSLLRNLLMRGFHAYLAVLGIAAIKDTQCGFKLFTRSAAKRIFPSMHVEGWIFDIEILIIATLLGDVIIREVPITWREVEGSKMYLVTDSIRMACDLLVIRGSYLLGRWKVQRT